MGGGRAGRTPQKRAPGIVQCRTCHSVEMGDYALQVEMAQLGAEGVLDTPHIPEHIAGQPERAPGAGEAVGGRVTVHFAGVGVWCRGEVLAYDPTREVSQDKLQPSHTDWLSSSRVCMHSYCEAETSVQGGKPYCQGSKQSP